MKKLIPFVLAIFVLGCEKKPSTNVNASGDDPQKSAPNNEGRGVAGAGKEKRAPGSAISIHRAAEQGDLESLKKHIAAGTDINTKDSDDGETPLHRAITRGQTEAARLLIEGGCNLNIGRTKDGDTPLDMAEGRGRTEIAELLREKGAKKSSDLPPVK
jgi:ankyrin repeat protein